jgi:putative membrane protein
MPLKPKSLVYGSMAAIAFASAKIAYAHGDETTTAKSEAALAWTWDPVIIAFLVLAAVLYGVGLRQLKKHSPETKVLKNWEIASFVMGWMMLVMALLSPLHKLGSMLFSAHMSQHEILMLLAAPLLVMGRPMVAALFALPIRSRMALGRVVKHAFWKHTWGLVSLPVAAWVIHGVVLWVWHVPMLYEATLRSEFIHALQHTSFLCSALLFWWTLIHGRFGRMGYGVAVVYVFSTAVHSSILGALLTFASQIWYPIYESRTAAWGLTPIEDQQLGGLIMWVPAGVVFVVVGLALFGAWLGESERRVRFTQSEALRTGGQSDVA